jgi:hypothetical protein
LLLLVAAASALAQNAAHPAKEEPASVAGVVTSALGGAPVARAHVTFYGWSERAQQMYGATTDADGKFEFRGLPPDSYSLRVEKTGFVTLPGETSPDHRIALGPGDRKENIQLKLTPVGEVSGRVTDADGEPMEFVSVVAAGRDPAASSDTVTGADGRFRIARLSPGRYWIVARPPGFRLPPEVRTDGSAEVHYAQTYAPSSLGRAGAMRVDVPPGGEVSGVEVRLLQTPIISLSGKVLGYPAGNRRDFGQVQLSGPDGSESGYDIQPDGSFRIWRPDPGKYRLTAVLNQVGAQRFGVAPVEIEVGESNIENIELPAVLPMHISGRLEYADRQAMPPKPAAQGQMQPSLLLSDIDGDNGPGYAGIGTDGSFQWENVDPGRYLVDVSWDGAYVTSLRLGSSEVSGAILDLSRGSGGLPLTVVLSSAAGQVSGTVRRTGGPAEGVRVALVPEGPEGSAATQFDTADAAGAYSFSGVRPGKYTLAALDDDDTEAAVRASGVDDYAGAAEHIDIPESGVLSKDLEQRRPDRR